MKRTSFLVSVALCAALIGLLSQVSVPSPLGVPITLQTFIVPLFAFLFGPSRAVLSLAVWMTLGACGVPWFAGFRGGVAVLLGPSGGFVAGLLFLALFCGLARSRSAPGKGILCAVGLLSCHATGLLVFCLITETPAVAAFLSLSLPFLGKDALCLIAAALCAGLRKRFPVPFS